MTRPFCTSTLAGGWANLHSLSEREHLLRWNSRHTSNCSHLESLTLSMLFKLTFTTAIAGCSWLLSKTPKGSTLNRFTTLFSLSKYGGLCINPIFQCFDFSDRMKVVGGRRRGKTRFHLITVNFVVFFSSRYTWLTAAPSDTGVEIGVVFWYREHKIFQVICYNNETCGCFCRLSTRRSWLQRIWAVWTGHKRW